MKKNNTVYTCYGCPAYYTPKDDPFKLPLKHCGEDHFKCPYYWGTGDPLIISRKGE